MSVGYLVSAFTQVQIKASNIRANHLSYQDRLATEIAVSGIEGTTWVDIPLLTARGTWDLLFLTSEDSLPCLLPGYLQWLWNPVDADVMFEGVLNILNSILSTVPKTFSRAQIIAMLEFLEAVARNQSRLLEVEQAELIQETIKILRSIPEDQ